MSKTAGKPYKGVVVIDVSDISDSLVFLDKEARVGLQAEKTGIEDVRTELDASMTSIGSDAGIPQEPYSRVVSLSEVIDKIRAHRRDMNLLAEVLTETEMKYVHERECALGIIVDTVRSVAHRTDDPALTGAFEKTIAYRGQSAKKAARTRKKNAALEAGEAPEEGTSDEGQTTTTAQAAGTTSASKGATSTPSNGTVASSVTNGTATNGQSH